MTLEELDQRVSWHPFTQMEAWKPLVIASGSGCYLYDRQGRCYLDGVSSLWCNVHGHRHPVLDAALREQLELVAHSTYLGLTHEPGIRLAAELLQVAPSGLSRVFFSDSGSTAVEIALKQSFQYWKLLGKSKKHRFIHFGEAYHGDTLGAVGVGGIDLFHRVFGPLLVQSIAVPSPALEPMALQILERVLDERDDVAAIVMEPLIQGAAGMLLHPSGFLRSVSELCREHDVHLVVDEVATGFGRTGAMFACEHESVAPDFLCLAKGISGGYLPLAATLTTEVIYDAFLGRRDEMRQFFHGHTYTANPLACAVGRASLGLLRDETLSKVQTHLPLLHAAANRVGRSPHVRDVRTCGLMIGIELHHIPDREIGAETCEAARTCGVILRPLGDVLVWMPPLVMGVPEIELLERATSDAIAACFT
jgi:adenosylmethionine-8-amino-7-oxononanoate aminotransferase